MNDATPQPKQHPANLTALSRQLKEMAARTKASSTDQRRLVQGPVLVIRGK